MNEGILYTFRLCKDINTEQLYVLKQISKKEMLKPNNYGIFTLYDLIWQEIMIMRTLEHQNIMWLHEVIDETAKEDYFYLVSKYF